MPQTKYTITLLRFDRTVTPVVHTLYRETDQEACDAAVRRLRLDRNTTPPNMPLFDMWTVSRPDLSHGVKIVGTGRYDDDHS